MGLMYSFSGRPPLTRGELVANLIAAILTC